MDNSKGLIFATAPPTIANLAVGFDILGLAIQAQGDVVGVGFRDTPGIQLTIKGDNRSLSVIPEQNTATAGVIQMLKDLGKEDIGIEVLLDKRMPLGSGMGSSASSAAAAVVAVNRLLGDQFSKTELSQYAMIGESVASGTFHGDNVIPSLMGGLILIRDNDPIEFVQLPFSDSLSFLIVHPHIEVMTKESRNRLKGDVALKDYIAQSSDIAAFVHAVHTNDHLLLASSLQDRIIGPQRTNDIPFFSEMSTISKKHGAMNHDISGSGPSSFAIFSDAKSAGKSGMEIMKMLATHDLESDFIVSKVDTRGAYILENV